MGQHCVRAEDDPPTKSQSKSFRYRKQTDDARSNAPRGEVVVEGPITSSSIYGMGHRSHPSAQMCDSSLIASSFREFSCSRFGGEKDTFLSVATADHVDGGIGKNAMICAGESRNISFINHETGHILRQWDAAHSKDINVLTRPSPTGVFFSASRDCTLKSWSISSPENSQVFSGHTLNVTAVDAEPDGRRVVSGSRDNSVRLWDTETAQQLCCHDVKLNIVHFVKWVPQLGCVAQGGEDLTVRLWDVRSGDGGMTLEHTLANFDYHPICADLGNGHTLYTGHNGFNHQGSMLTEWDLRMQRQVRRFVDHAFTVRSLRYLHSGPRKHHIVSASDDGTMKLWDTRDANDVVRSKMSSTFSEGRISAVDETSDGKILVSCRSGTIIVLLPTPEGQVFERHRYVGVPNAD